MKLRSFRLRIALLSVLLAGSALVGFSIASWLLIYETKLARLDSEIKNQVLQKAVRPHWATNWQSYERSLPSVLGVTQQNSAALVVSNIEGQTLYQSLNWPSGVDLTSLSQPVSQFPPQLLPPPRPRLPPEGEPPHPHLGMERPPEERQRLPPAQAPEEPPINLNELGKLVQIATKSTNNISWRVGVITTPGFRIAIAVSFADIDREMSAIRNIFLIFVPTVLILVAIGAWALSGSALQPIHEVTLTIRRVTAKGLDKRIPTGATDVEFAELIEVFNQMMGRLERSFKQASRFSGDAAHELKTPLAILQGELERTLQRAKPGSELQQGLSEMLDEVSRLGSIIRKLLLLSLADAGQMRLHRVEVNLSQVLADLVEDIEMLAPHLEVQTQIASPLQTLGDRDLLIQVLQNMISNAIKYNLPSGWVKIQALYIRNTVSITVTNSSHDIQASQKERIFERFHRGDAAHNRQIEGFGLGLSLSRELARAHGGDLKLEPTPSGQTAFTLTLPAGI